MDKYVIPNLKNACRVLKRLTEEPGGMSVAEVTRQLKIPRTTALRILHTLRGEGMVDLHERNYRLGPELIRLGARALEGVDVRTAAIPVLAQLANETRETSHLAVRSGDKALLLEVCDSPHPVRVASRPGTLTDIHCSATGKVLLAYQVDDLHALLGGKELVARTPNSRTTIEGLEEEIRRVRECGYAIDEEEYSPGVRCLAAPIRDSLGAIVAAIGITAGTSSFTKRRIKSVARTVIAAAERVSATLGGGVG
jgi:DNA-binding IclR family transcriptional regulator